MEKNKKTMTWNDITLDMMCAVDQVVRDTSLTPLEISVKCVHILTGEDEANLSAMDLQDFNALYACTAKILEKKPTRHVEKSINIGGTRYDIHYDLHDMNVAAYIDYTTYAQEMDRCKAEKTPIPAMTYAALLSTLVIPHNAKYNDGSYSLSHAQRDMLLMPWPLVEGVMATFTEVCKSLCKLRILQTKAALDRALKENPELKDQQTVKKIEELEQAGLHLLGQSLNDQG